MIATLTTTQPHLRIAIEFPPAAIVAHAAFERRLTLPVYLSNHSDYPAQFPFLCVMDLGLNLLPEGSWALDRISADGRKLIRCAFQLGATLLPGDRIHAMSLIVNIVPEHGMRLSFDANAPIPLETLRDLKLFTVTGAANFPSQRSSTSLSADALRRALLLSVVQSEPQRVAI